MWKVADGWRPLLQFLLYRQEISNALELSKSSEKKIPVSKIREKFKKEFLKTKGHDARFRKASAWYALLLLLIPSRFSSSLDSLDRYVACYTAAGKQGKRPALSFPWIEGPAVYLHMLKSRAIDARASTKDDDLLPYPVASTMMSRIRFI